MMKNETGGNYIVLWLPSEFDDVMRSTPGPRLDITNEGRAAYVSGTLMALAEVMGFPDVKAKLIAHNEALHDEQEQDST